jgi:hypothetical protein
MCFILLGNPGKHDAPSPISPHPSPPSTPLPIKLGVVNCRLTNQRPESRHVTMGVRGGGKIHSYICIEDFFLALLCETRGSMNLAYSLFPPLYLPPIWFVPSISATTTSATIGDNGHIHYTRR